MLQVQRKQIYSGKIDGISVINETNGSLKEGQVCYGYLDEVKNSLYMGMKLPIGEVVSVEKKKVVILTKRGFSTIDWSVADRFSCSKYFVVKETEGGEIGRYELLYYLQHIHGSHTKFDTDLRLKRFHPLLKETLLNLVIPISNSLFVNHKSRIIYTDEDINMENLEKGKRYRKLVFVRFVGMIVTKLFFPGESIVNIAKPCGYTNHTMFYHALKTFRNFLLYDKQMSDIIIQLFNDSLRQVQPSLFREPSTQLQES